jgi:hypothetical protein
LRQRNLSVWKKNGPRFVGGGRDLRRITSGTL